MREMSLIAKGKAWWDSNGYNMDRWNRMPVKQRYAIARDAQSKGWPKRIPKQDEFVQMKLFG